MKAHQDVALSFIEDQVRQLVRARGLDPSADGLGGVQQLVEEVLDDYSAQVDASDLPPIPDKALIAKQVVDRVAGLGPLQSLIDDPSVEELWINGPGKVFCARQGQHELTNITLTEPEVKLLVERMLGSSGRRIDLSSPLVDATLPDGSRLHVAIPGVTRRYWAVNIRKFVLRANRLSELVRLGSLDQQSSDFLSAAVIAGLNIVVSGATQSGKTTMLNCLASAIPLSDRVITCEEVFELQIALPDVVGMQTRAPSMEGLGEIDLRRLIMEALRMRPDRIIVGEVRQREALDLLVALNSGLPGMTSIHANSAPEAVTKLTTLPLLAGENVTHSFLLPTVAASIDLIVHLVNRRGRRRVEQVLGVTGRVEGNVVETASLFERRGPKLIWTGLPTPRVDRFEDAGIDVKGILR